MTVYPPTILRKYPHMMPNDIAIWERFLVSEHNTFDSFSYDVHVGTGRGYSDFDPEWKITLAKALTCFRIDAVGYHENIATIIEVKPFASLSALGQIIAYSNLWQINFPDKPVEALLIVTDSTSNDVKTVLKANSILLIEVGPSSP